MKKTSILWIVSTLILLGITYFILQSIVRRNRVVSAVKDRCREDSAELCI
jgi:hypothetical protein